MRFLFFSKGNPPHISVEETIFSPRFLDSAIVSRGDYYDSAQLSMNWCMLWRSWWYSNFNANLMIKACVLHQALWNHFLTKEGSVYVRALSESIPLEALPCEATFSRYVIVIWRHVRLDVESKKIDFQFSSFYSFSWNLYTHSIVSRVPSTFFFLLLRFPVFIGPLSILSKREFNKHKLIMILTIIMMTFMVRCYGFLFTCPL